MDLQTNIEGIKEKIRKTNNLLEKANNLDESETDKSALKEKLRQLNDKLREYEKSNDQIISAIASSNREIRNLTEEIYSEKKTTLASSSRFSVKEDEKNDILKAHYESDVEQLNQFKQREAYTPLLKFSIKSPYRELNEQTSKTSSQIKEMTHNVKELNERIDSLQNNRSATEEKIKSIHLQVVP